MKGELSAEADDMFVHFAGLRIIQNEHNNLPWLLN